MTAGLCTVHRFTAAFRSASARLERAIGKLDLQWSADGLPLNDDTGWFEHCTRYMASQPASHVPAPYLVKWADKQRSLCAARRLPPARRSLLSLLPGWQWVPVDTGETERLRMILEAFDSGDAMREIGARFGLTAERIRQIVQPYRQPRGRSGRSRPLSPEVCAKGIRDALGGQPVTHDRLRRWLKLWTPSPLVMPLMSASKRTYSDAEWVATWVDRVQRATKDLKQPLTLALYDRWAKAHDEPGHQTMYRTQMGWIDLCLAADVEVARKGTSEWPRSDRRFDTDFCVAALGRFVATSIKDNRRPTYHGYTQWARRHQEPSGPTVRVRVNDVSETISTITHRILSGYFDDALAMLDAGIAVDPATYSRPHEPREMTP